MNYVKLRPELKEHLQKSRMSPNAVTLFVWLLLSAHGGCVGAGYDDLRHALGWSYSMVRRILEELVSKGYVSVAPAPNQHRVTVIKLLRLDLVEGDSAVLTGEHPEEHKNSAVLNAVSTNEQSQTSNKLSAAALSTGEQSSEQSSEQRVALRAVPDVPPGDDPVEAVAARIAGPSEKGAIPEPGNATRKRSEGFEIPVGCLSTNELIPTSKDLLEFVGFACDRRFLSRGFMTIVEKYAKLRPWPRPGVLASKLIERALHWQRKRRNEGKSALLYAWPPGFQKHRDRLRVAEREAGRKERQRAT